MSDDGEDNGGEWSHSDYIAQRIEAAGELLKYGSLKPKDTALQSRIDRLVDAAVSSMNATSAETKEIAVLVHEAQKRELKRG